MCDLACEIFSSFNVEYGFLINPAIFQVTPVQILKLLLKLLPKKPLSNSICKVKTLLENGSDHRILKQFHVCHQRDWLGLPSI